MSIKYRVLSIKWLLGLLLPLFVLATPGEVLASTLSLSPANGNFNKGCNFTVNINLDTQGAQTDGTDAIIFYDASRFTPTSIQNGTIYADYPGSNIDPTGKITVSGLASVSQPFTGSGTLATINFQVTSSAPTGAAQLTFDFDPNNKTKTTDSNVVERGTVVDTLSAVTNGSYVIGTGSCASQTSTGSGGGPSTSTGSATTTTTTTTTLPKAGTETLTYTLAIVGSVLAVLGVLGLAIL